MNARDRRRASGFSHAEVLAAAVLLALAVIPAIEALRAGAAVSDGFARQAVLSRELASRVEEVLAEPYAELAAEAAAAAGAPTAYSDPAGTADRRLVFLAGYDADGIDGDANPFTGADPGLLWVRAEIAATPLAHATLTTP